MDSNIENNNKKPILEAINLSKRYEDNALALDNVSFTIHPGEIFAMLGGNGAGKTTTINLFLNLIEPTSGDCKIDGVSCVSKPLEAKKKVAYVSENVMLYPDFTAMQNLDFFIKLGGRMNLSKDEYKSVLKRVGLQEDAFNKKLKGFSKGMRQKCGIAISILKDAPAILLDEPTSGLDPKAGAEFVNLLKELKKEGKAILMSTHDIFRAKDVADTIGIMNKGQLVMKKKQSEIHNEDLEQLYIKYMAGYMENAA